MKPTATLVCAILAAAFVACSSTPATPATPAAPAAYADRWQFPATVGKFHGGAVDAQGAGDARRIIATYMLDIPGGPVFVNVTVSRVGGASDLAVAEQQFLSDRVSILKAHGIDTPPPPSTAGSITAGGRDHPGLVAKFTLAEPFDGKTRDMDTHAYFFRDGDWAVRYRFTFPSAVRPQAETAIADFLSKLVWPAVQ